MKVISGALSKDRVCHFLFLPQTVCSSFGTVVTPSHAASSLQSVASPGFVLIEPPVQRSQESPFL